MAELLRAAAFNAFAVLYYFGPAACLVALNVIGILWIIGVL